MSEIQDLVNERKQAIERGDKIAGRDIYHRLQALGVSASDIDADTVPTDEPADVQADVQAEVSAPVETTAAAELPERA